MPSSNGLGAKKAILYARVSTKGQVERGFSLRQQLEALRKHAEVEDYEILAEVTDNGYSGATLYKPGLDRVRDLVAKGGVAIVLTQDRDRISREPGYRFLLEQEFKKHGTVLKALDGWGSDTHEGQLLNGIKDQIARYEQPLITERTRRGRLQRAREGKVVPSGTPPLGFTYDRDAGNYRIDEKAMLLVRRIFLMIGEEGKNLHAVKRTFESEGVRTAGGARFWNTNTIRRLILYDVYRPHSYKEVASLVSQAVAARLDPARRYGILWYNRHHTDTSTGKRKRGTMKPREEWVAVPLPDAGISRELVDKVRTRLEDKTRPSRADNYFWALSGRAFCACGCRLSCRTTKPRHERYHYYVCSRYDKNGKEACEHGRRHRAEPLEAQVFRAVWELVSDPHSLRSQIQKHLDQEREALKDKDEAIKNAYEVLEDMAQQRERYQKMGARGLITLDELEAHLEELDERKGAAEEELERLFNAQERIEYLDCIEDSCFLHAIAYVRSEKEDDELLRALYDELELKVIVSKEGSAWIEGIFSSRLITSTRAEATATGSGGAGSGSTRARLLATPQWSCAASCRRTGAQAWSSVWPPR